MHRDLEARGEPRLFYDPLGDEVEYIWLSWRDVARPVVIERLICVPFEPGDFVSETNGSRIGAPADGV